MAQQSQMENWRSELQNLNWTQGYSKEELMTRFPNIPQSYFQNVPSGLKFYSFNEFWNYFAPAGTPGVELGEAGAVPHAYPRTDETGRQARTSGGTGTDGH
jgi:hypothetical protein